MGNAFAYLVLLGFVPMGLALFLALRPISAALAVFLGSFMFLPELVAFDLPLVPLLGKQEIAGIAALGGTLLAARHRLVRARPLRGPDIFIVLLCVGDIATALTNRDVLVVGPVVLPALTLHEGISMVLGDILVVYVPFLIGRALCVTPRSIHTVLIGLVVGGLFYTPFLLVELTMSPQLHAWVYGFHQHEFVQTLRGGGYRPTVFMPHGLAVGLFMAWATIAAFVLLRARRAVVGIHPALCCVWNMAFLIACKSLGAALYALPSAVAVLSLRSRNISRVATFAATLVVAYPSMRAADLFPVKTMTEIAQIVSERASQSLHFRFDMESLLSTRAAERPLFGWGRFRRSMTFDVDTGRPTSVSDGHWIVTYGIRGAWGFLCTFGLIVAPIFFLARRLHHMPCSRDRLMIVGLALILVVGAVDLLPNGLHNNFTIFLAGALWGVTHALTRRGRGSAPTGVDDAAK